MAFFDLFKSKRPPTASVAKDRLTILVARQREDDGRRQSFSPGATPDYLPAMREELLAVVRKYIKVPDSAVKVDLQKEGGLEVLEMNITLPDRDA